MKTRAPEIRTILIASLFLTIQFAYSENASKLYEKVMLHEQARARSTNYRNALKSHEAALKCVERIRAELPDSNIAHRLMSDDFRISGYSLSEYKALGEDIRPRAEAEQNPLACALLFANAINVRPVQPNAEKDSTSQREEDQTASLSPRMRMRIKKEQEAISSFTASFAAKMNSYSRAFALELIAIKYAETGQNEKALQLLSETVNAIMLVQSADSTTIFADMSLANIAGLYVELGCPEKALETTLLPRQESWKIIAMGRMAIAYAESGQTEDSDRMLSRIFESANTLDQKDIPGWNRSQTLLHIAQTFATKNMNDTACVFLSEALDAARKDPSSATFASMETHKITTAFAQARHLSEALKSAYTIEHQYYKALALADIAEQYTEEGHREEAARVLLQALQATEKIEADDMMVQRWMEQAQKAVTGGRKEFAAQAMSETLDAAAKAHNQRCSYQAVALAAIGVQFSLIGENEKSSTILSQALEVAREVEHLSWRAIELTKIAEHHLELRQKEQAEVILAEALGSTKESVAEYPLKKGQALAGIASQYAGMNRHQQALATAETINKASWRASALAEIADSSANLKELELVLKAAETIDNQAHKDRALIAIADRCIELEEFDRIFSIVRMCSLKNAELAQVAGRIAGKREFTKALELAAIITDEYPRSMALAEIAGQYFQTEECIRPEEVDLLTRMVEERYPLELYMRENATSEHSTAKAPSRSTGR